VRSFAEIGAAVVGTGFIGAVHVEALRRLGVQVHGVVGSTRERAAARAAEIGLPQAYGSFQAMLDDPRVDVVHVTSPNHLHHEHSRAALRAGKHVVCEKPLAMTPAESADLLQIAEHSGLVHATNFNLRFYPVVQHVHGMVREGALGEVRLVSGHYLQDWLLLDTDWNWRLEPELGGVLRAVSDIGSHWMDLTTFLTGKRIVAVMADLATFIKKRRQPSGPMETFATGRGVKTVERDISTEDCATILLRYEDGTRGAVTVSQISAGRKNSLLFEVDGSTSAVGWNSERPDELWIGHRDGANEIVIKYPSLLAPAAAAYADLPGGHSEGYDDTFKQLFRRFYQSIREDGIAAEYPQFAAGLRQMRVLDAVLASHRGRAWVDVAAD